MSSYIEIDNVDVNAIELRKSKSEKKQGKMYNVFHQGRRLEVVLPEMDAPFGAKILTDYGCKVSLTLSFTGMDENTKRGVRLKRTHAKLLSIQEKIHSLILGNTAEYFKDKKKMSMEVLKERVKNFIHESKGKDGKEYADVFRTELQRYTPGEKDKDKTPEEIDFLKKQFVYGRDAKSLFKNRSKSSVDVDLDNIEDVIGWGTRLKPIVSFAYVWVMGSDQKCTPKWYITHALITSDKSKMEIDLNPDEEEEEEEEVQEVQEEDELMEDEEEYEEEVQAQARV
jgi:hypothetical protein